jgi:hypothetical protein
MINGATTCPSSSAESGGVDFVPGAPRSAASAPCTVELTAGVPPGLVARSGEVCPSAAPRNWYWPVQICACARSKNSVQGCAESRCLRAAQILRSPLNDQRCNDVSPLICGVWRCRLRAWCAPICSVLHVYGGAHCWGPARPRFACSGEVRRAPQL